MFPALALAVVAGTAAGLLLFRRRGGTPVAAGAVERWMPEPVDVPARRHRERAAAAAEPTEELEDAWEAITAAAEGADRGTGDVLAALTAVKGLGEVRAARVVAEFPSLSAVRAAGVAGLTSVKGIGPAMADRILEATA